MDCISDINDEVDANVYKTRVAITDPLNTVADLDKQLKACSTTGSILCISPVVRQIDVDKVELPELIDSETHKTVVLVETITPKVDQCSDSNVSTYVTDASKLLGLIEDCVNGLLP